MGFCMHVVGVECENCRGKTNLSEKVMYPLYYGPPQPTMEERLIEVERKLHLIMKHLGVRDDHP